MPVGGWIYGSCELLPAAKSEAQTLIWLSQLEAVMAAMAGWSVKTAAFIVAGTTFHQALSILEHTSGAEVALLWQANGTSPVIHADNVYDGVAVNASAGTDPWGYLAWCPSTSGGFVGTNPGVAGFVPADGFGFVDVSTEEWDLLYTTGHMWFHFMVRDDEIILAVEEDSHLLREIDSVHFAGEIFDTLANAADTLKYAILSIRNPQYVAQGSMGGLNDSTRQIHYQRADGTKMYGLGTGLGSNLTDVLFVDESILLDPLVTDGTVKNWVAPTMYLKSTNLTLYGIVPGEGKKGSLNPEMFRNTRLGISNKGRLTQGAEVECFMHLLNGVCVGWNSTNGPMN